MTYDEILLDTEERMEKALNIFRDELRGLRTGRATPALVDSIRVDYYGSPTPLKQLAQISTPDPQQIVIRPFDQGSLKDIEKAIRSSDLGMAPNNDGKVIRLTVPAMSDSISFRSFIASMMQSVWPLVTDWPTSTKAGEPGEGER